MTRILLLNILLCLIFCKTQAQSKVVATASATATIVSPIGTSMESEMNFGSFTSKNSPGEVILTPFNDLFATGGVKLSSPKEKGEAAVFTIYGSNNYFEIALPAECIMVRKDGFEAMRMCWFDALTSPAQQENFAETISIGATIQVNAFQVPGVYEPATPFDVMVYYN